MHRRPFLPQMKIGLFPGLNFSYCIYKSQGFQQKLKLDNTFDL